MPLISTAKIRAGSDHSALALHVEHCYGDGDGGAFIGCIPLRTAVYAAQTIVLGLSGVLNNAGVSAQHLSSSQLVRHLVDFLQTNAQDLVLDAIGKPCLDASRGTLLLPITPQFASRNPRTYAPHLILSAINLRFSWKTVDEDDPFAALCPLPYLTMLNDIISRFVTWQLARRYPLVFGSWCKQLAAENPSIFSIQNSINAIIKRSTNRDFRKHCRCLFKTLRRQARRSIGKAADALSEHLPANPQSSISTEEAFFLAMEDIYKQALRRRTFKGISRLANDRLNAEEHFLQGGSGSDGGHSSSPLDDMFADIVPMGEAFGSDSVKTVLANELLDEDLIERLEPGGSQDDGNRSLGPRELEAGPGWTTPFFSDLEDDEETQATAKEHVLEYFPIVEGNSECSRPCSRGSLDQLDWNDGMDLPHFLDDHDPEEFLLDEDYYYEEDIISDIDHEAYLLTEEPDLGLHEYHLTLDS